MVRSPLPPCSVAIFTPHIVQKKQAYLVTVTCSLLCLSMDEEMAGYQSGIFSLEDSIDSSINMNVARAVDNTKPQGWAFLLSIRLISFTNTECFLYTSNGKWWECSIKKVEQLCHQIAQWSESVSFIIVLSYQSTACLTLTWPLYNYTTNKGLLSRDLRCQEVPAADCIYLDCLLQRVTKRQERDSNEYRETDMTMTKEIMIVKRHKLTTKGCKKKQMDENNKWPQRDG